MPREFLTLPADLKNSSKTLISLLNSQGVKDAVEQEKFKKDLLSKLKDEQKEAVRVSKEGKDKETRDKAKESAASLAPLIEKLRRGDKVQAKELAGVTKAGGKKMFEDAGQIDIAPAGETPAQKALRDSQGDLKDAIRSLEKAMLEEVEGEKKKEEDTVQKKAQEKLAQEMRLASAGAGDVFNALKENANALDQSTTGYKVNWLTGGAEGFSKEMVAGGEADLLISSLGTIANQARAATFDPETGKGGEALEGGADLLDHVQRTISEGGLGGKAGISTMFQGRGMDKEKADATANKLMTLLTSSGGSTGC